MHLRVLIPLYKNYKYRYRKIVKLQLDQEFSQDCKINS